MAKPIIITGKTELLAAIYNEDLLPSAIVDPTGADPYCLHSLREGDESLFNQLLESGCDAADVEFKPENYEQAKFKLYKFYEDYPSPNHTCIGCAGLADRGKGERHRISDTEVAASKLCADCA